ncbi:uncharacterized protein LOC143462427 [Clavelina lepadiformis]|uniref:P-type domain-containing protein n=1 Tax=Clavelina lepadiformis TaxID=159417 RepID=A0ABP0GF31_CLALP
MFRLLLALACIFCASRKVNSCNTDILSEDRIDCNVRPNDQEKCETVGCVWCPVSQANIAACFLNYTDNFNVILAAASNCNSRGDCQIAVNCHPDIITYQPNQASCESRGCLWLGTDAIDDQPRCVYYNNSIIEGYTLFSGAFPLIEASAICASCDNCFHKINCLPNEPSYRITENRCLREGCIWCSETNECLFGATSGLDGLAPLCKSCTDCPLQAYIKASSQAICRKKRGTWCSNRPSSPDDKRCAIISDNTFDECSFQKLAASTCTSCDNCQSPIIDCSSTDYYETPYTCVEKGCMWCPNNKTEPTCRYGTNNYRCVSADFCDIQFPRFQNIVFSRTSSQRPHLSRLMEVFCYSQMGVWAPSTYDRCLSPSPYNEAPLARDLTKIYHYYQ